jgi:putative membrane protein insertion efficiency factor
MLLVFFRAYQIFLSPFLGGACKFYPSCSNYAYQAVERHGARRGLVLVLKRLGRCRPFTKGGVDLVPDADESPVFPRERNLLSPAQCHAASLVASTEKEPKQ